MVETRESLSYQPKVQIYGWTHNALNVQGAQRAGSAFKDFAASLPPSSSVVFFDEYTDISTSSEIRDGISMLISNYGLVALEVARAYARLHGEPLTHAQLDIYMRELESLDVGELVRRSEGGDFPLNLRLSTYVLYRYLDRLDLHGRAFFFETERHRKLELDRFRSRDDYETRKAEEMERCMDEGEVEGAASALRKCVYDFNRTHIRYREHRIARQVASLTRRYPLDGIFMVYGAAHLGMGKRIERLLPGMKVQVGGIYSQSPYANQVSLLRNPEAYPDFDFKCELLTNELMNRVMHQCREEGLLSGFALRFEDIQNDLWSLMNSFSEHDLDTILAGGIHGLFHDVYNVVRAQIYQDDMWN